MVDKYAPCPCGSGEKYKFCCMGKAGCEDQYRLVLADQSGRSLQREDEVARRTEAISLDLEDGRLPQAKRKARSLLDHYPDSPLAHFFLGTCHLAEGDTASAIRHLELAVAGDDRMEYLFNLGGAYLKHASAKNAARTLAQVVARRTEDPELAKRAEEQLAWLEQTTLKIEGISLDEHVQQEERFEVAYQHLRCGRFEDAIHGFQGMLAVRPDHVQSHGNLGIAYAYVGDKQRALQHLDRALELDPEYEPAIVNRRAVLDLGPGEKLKANLRLEVEHYREKVWAERR
ncbi:MAG: tetratricopeptide repeat protein [Deltaproteobacteria bacterium]|nr:tetratricopeptide repeat protein [Deltaproteobacteria bacterium]